VSQLKGEIVINPTIPKQEQNANKSGKEKVDGGQRTRFPDHKYPPYNIFPGCGGVMKLM
jgi:hypothetical protein